MITQQPIVDEDGNVDEDIRLPAILKSKSMILTDEEFENCELQSVTSLPKVPSKSDQSTTEPAAAVDSKESPSPEIDKKDDPPSKENENAADIPAAAAKDVEKVVEPPPDLGAHKVKLPAIWAPKNARGHACYIYYFFRHVRYFAG